MDSDDLWFFDEIINNFINLENFLLIEHNWFFYFNFFMNDRLNSLNNNLFDNLGLHFYNFMYKWYLYDFLNLFFNLYPLYHWLLDDNWNLFNDFPVDRHLSFNLDLDRWLCNYISNLDDFLNNFWNFYDSILNLNNRHDFFNNSIDYFIFCNNLICDMWSFIINGLLHNNFL